MSDKKHVYVYRVLHELVITHATLNGHQMAKHINPKLC